MEQKLFLLLICVYGICCQDPCTNHRQLNDETRSVDHSLGMSETENCDRLISKDWYVLQDNGTIPTECPPLLRCGSTGPIWMNGSLPDANNEVTRPVCQVGFVGCCESTWKIRVKNCGSFYVFYLTPTPACPGRFCIEGPPAPCQPEWGSENGLEPCSPTNITFAVTPYVHPYIPTLNNTPLAFECRVNNMPSAYHSYIFDIQWSIDDKLVVVKKEVVYSAISDQGSMHRKDWDPKNEKTLGIRVTCAIRARLFLGAPPTEYSTSSEFYAGVTVQSTSLYVRENDVALIQIRSTVPILCGTYQGVVYCDIRMELYSYRDEIKKQEQSFCNQSLTVHVTPSACGLDFDGVKWNQYQTISVSAFTDQTSRPSYSAVVKLKAVSGRDTLWRDYFLPDITVNVVGVKRPTGRCYSYTDPNIRTVDGRGFVSLATGEFVLYKLKKTPVEVHTIQDKVGQNCAVAVRAASDIFIVYGCGSPKKWIVRRLNCNEQTQHLKVFERSLGTAFEIILPSGTRVNIGIRRNSWLNVEIFPSFTDWKQTEGKCGTYNGDSSDDFTDRNGDIVGVADFIRSWGVTQMESLFVAKIRNEILSIPFFYCSCLPDEFPDGPITEKADCSWEDSLPTCPPLNWGQKKCQLLGKREAIDDVEIDVPENMITFEESTMSTDWKNGWNATFARQKCEYTLHRSPIFKDCSSLQNVQNDQTIESCITDIQVSGSDIFLSDVIERMKSECLSELRFNASLWNNNTESSEPSLIDTVFDNACPNDCSFAGTCTKGQCFCEPSYTGDDCSIKTDRPPILYDASEESLCDLSKRPCTSTSVFGEGFFSSASIKCKLTQATLIESTIVEGNVTKIETGNLESFAEVKCPIAGIINRRKRSATKVSDPDVILVSVSMDGTKFSSSVPVVMFNSSCSSCVISGNTVACDIRSDICIRNGECFEITNENCASSNIAPVEHVYPTISLIIGIVVGSVCLLAIVVLVVVKMYNHKRRFVKNIDEPNFTMGLAQESGSAPVSHKFK